MPLPFALAPLPKAIVGVAPRWYQSGGNLLPDARGVVAFGPFVADCTRAQSEQVEVGALLRVYPVEEEDGADVPDGVVALATYATLLRAPIWGLVAAPKVVGESVQLPTRRGIVLVRPLQPDDADWLKLDPGTDVGQYVRAGWEW